MHTITTTNAAALARLAALDSEIESTPVADLDNDHPLFIERDEILDQVAALPTDSAAALAAKVVAYRSINPELQGTATDERLLIQIFGARTAPAIDSADELPAAA